MDEEEEEGYQSGREEWFCGAYDTALCCRRTVKRRIALMASSRSMELSTRRCIRSTVGHSSHTAAVFAWLSQNTNPQHIVPVAVSLDIMAVGDSEF